MRIARPTSHDSRQGYSLRDLFVAIFVLGILLMLAIQFTQNSKVPSWRTHCQNNQHQLATAMLNYEALHGRFPGSAGLMPSKGKAPGPVVGYLPPLLCYLERNDLAKLWHAGHQPTPYISMLLCPVDNDQARQGGELSYVVNGGVAVNAQHSDVEIQASGVCFDQTGLQRSPISVDLQYLLQNDGAANTLLLSENLQAGTWAITTTSSAKRWNTFVWFEDPVPPEAPINQKKNWPSSVSQSINFARPSSNHQGGVNVHFCDGHYEFVQDGIDYKVWRQMMTSNSTLWP